MGWFPAARVIERNDPYLTRHEVSQPASEILTESDFLDEDRFIANRSISKRAQTATESVVKEAADQLELAIYRTGANLTKAAEKGEQNLCANLANINETLDKLNTTLTLLMAIKAYFAIFPYFQAIAKVLWAK